MSQIKIQQLFKAYQHSFINYDMDGVSSCYHLPCTLNTPDKIVLLTSRADCQREFGEIFTQLKEANTSDVIAKKASFVQMSEQLYLVCIDWYFIDDQGEVFADFAAIYHVLDTDGVLKIINVVSHELESSLTLTESLSW
jgi:hypothetical protein